MKGGVYRLDDLGGAEELAKDVAAFANVRTGGLLLVGFGTRKEHDSEVLDQVRPVPRSLVDLDRYRKLIRERVIPAPREVSVEWVSCGDGKGVMVIDVPAQPPGRLPHVVARPGRSGDAGRVSVAVPIREVAAGAAGGDPLSAIGFPVPEPEATRVVDADATCVDLTGGQWGDGTLIRDATGTQWRWEPAIRFSMNMTRAAETWTGPPEPQLRLRAIATLPQAQAHDLAITAMPPRPRAGPPGQRPGQNGRCHLPAPQYPPACLSL